MRVHHSNKAFIFARLIIVLRLFMTTDIFLLYGYAWHWLFYCWGYCNFNYWHITIVRITTYWYRFEVADIVELIITCHKGSAKGAGRWIEWIHFWENPIRCNIYNRAYINILICDLWFLQCYNLTLYNIIINVKYIMHNWI